MGRIEREEVEIIEAVRRGDIHLYSRLVVKYKNPVFNLAYRLTGNRSDADDLAQETFVHAFEQLHRFDIGKPFFSWLYTIALNLARNHLKRTARMMREEIRVDIAAEGMRRAGHETEAVQREARADALEQCIQMLPRDLREAIVLKFYEGLQFADVGEILQISVGAAKMRVYRGLEKLKSMMQEEEPVAGDAV
jgi:RNA polymerase sigma-70 factor, ECF subfamily